MKVFFIVLLTTYSVNLAAQPVFKDALKANRDRLYRNLVNNTITKNLSLPLSDSTEENWQDAFTAMGIIHYTSPWAENRLHVAVAGLSIRSIAFQRSLLELIYSDYAEMYYPEVKLLLMQSTDPKIFAMCAVCILNSSHAKEDIHFLAVKTKQQLSKDPENPLLLQLLQQLNTFGRPPEVPDISSLMQSDYLPGNVVVLSFQRSDRNFPGLVMVRDTSGRFLSDSNGIYFHVPQLARANSNLPGYLTNGNTPEGIFRMDGFDQSKSSFIGPTTNIQLTMPFECKATHFFRDSSLTDSSWEIGFYKKLLPGNLQSYYPAFQSYYAGKAGRTAIIAHGTTVNPDYYLSAPYYPMTPTQGCLCTKEIWDEETGRRRESDQQRLADAVKKAGGPFGYAIVINIDDKRQAVTLNDILPYLNKIKKQ